MKERSKVGRPARRDPLLTELENDTYVTERSLNSGRGAARRARAKETKDGGDDPFLPEDLSRRLLSQARDQQAEIEAEEDGGGAAVQSATRRGFGHAVAAQRKAVRHSSRRAGADSESDDDEAGGSGGLPRRFRPAGGDDDDDDGLDDAVRQVEARTDMEEAVAGITEEDERALELFRSSKPVQAKRTLADIIAEKIKEKEAEIATAASELSARPTQTIDPKVVAVYRTVGQMLAKYRSGALPKAFKIIPTLSNWEEILYLTNPDEWSNQAMYQATRIFASNLKEKMAQRFYNLVLYPRIRQDFEETKKLNYHLYMALKKSLYKPAAFFKGILLPLCEAGDCSLREAAIIGSVITKVSIPVLHSAAAMLKLAQMEYTGTNSLFLRVLIDKKYALPFRVVDALVDHFVRFQDDHRQMPVLWHQALLVFAQRYKEEMAVEQKEALLTLLRSQKHYAITLEVRRELVNSKCRGDDEEVLGEEALRERALRLAALAQDENPEELVDDNDDAMQG